MKKTADTRKPQRGMALILTMLIVLVMIVLVGSMLGVITGELNSVSFAGFDNRALYSADAGVQFAQEQIDNYAATNATPPPSASWSETLPADPSGGSATFTASLDPTPFLRNGNLYYLVHSEGKAPGGGDRKVDAILEVQSYTHYEYYTYQNNNGNWFVEGLNTFDGPVYMQGTADTLNFQWYSGLNKPIFLSTAIIAGNYGYAPSAPTTNSEWTQIAAAGAGAITQTSKVGYVPYPPTGSTYKAANQAFNGTYGTSSLPAPGANDVYINGGLAKLGSGSLSSGIFIQGNANIVMSAPTTTTEVFTISPVTKGGVSAYGSGYSSDYTNTIPTLTTITVDYSANTTKVVEGAKTATYNGVPQNQPTGSVSTENGSIFVNGNVDSITGTLNGQYTIAVPDIQTSGSANVKDIIATGDIKYKSDPTLGTSTDVLGLMCDNFKLGPDSITPKVVKIQADIIAGNQYEASKNLPDGGFGTVQDVSALKLMTSVNIYGSIIQNEVKPMGQFDGGTGALVTGWMDTYNYDTRQMTPPDWPTLGTGLVAWKDAGSPIY